MRRGQFRSKSTRENQCDSDEAIIKWSSKLGNLTHHERLSTTIDIRQMWADHTKILYPIQGKTKNPTRYKNKCLKLND